MSSYGQLNLDLQGYKQNQKINLCKYSVIIVMISAVGIYFICDKQEKNKSVSEIWINFNLIYVTSIHLKLNLRTFSIISGY